MEIVAGDIGGTNTRLALYRAEDGTGLQAIHERTFPSGDYDSLEAILERFIRESDLKAQRACFGVAGPVIDQTCETTNLPWRLSAAEINRQFNYQNTWLLNDLEANAWGIGALDEQDFHTLQAGNPTARGNASIISAGTGLGQAGLYWDGTFHRPFPSEGGHTDFSPATALEFALYESLAAQHGHVSWERLVSGPGLETIYDFLLTSHKTAAPDWLRNEMNEHGAAPAISRGALENRDPICLEALDLFIELYGREAGNHALKLMASGGVYLGGGIAPRILPRLAEGGFLRSFNAKGRMRHLMQAMPVKVILNDKAALLGAARFASLQ